MDGQAQASTKRRRLSCFVIWKNGLQILRIQRGGIRNKSHQPARTFVQVSNGYISARTRARYSERRFYNSFECRSIKPMAISITFDFLHLVKPSFVELQFDSIL